ncbi:MAG TPA: DUF3857 domain-containing protein [Prolixibacteraceae bacterium]|nr:DUF3857 domain-containing protein [Prolixibacteraceae bacterium]
MRTSILLLLLTCCFISFGQNKEPKFGKIDLTEMNMTRYEKDTTADALMLFDNGTSRFVINQDRNFQIVFERHCRMKVFKNTAFYLTNFKINLSKSGQNEENLNNLKAVTYNLVDGKIAKTKLEKENIFREESKSHTTVKFAFPEVKEGSIIELSYTITSDFLYNFRGWNFQYNIPALWSQYSYTIPEYFYYQKLSKGYLPFDIIKEESGKTTYTLHYEAEIGSSPNSERTPSQYYNISADVKNCTFATKDVPAFIVEPNIDCEDNYIQSIEFELGSIKFPHEVRKDYAQTWESVNQQMNDDEDFGRLLKSKGFIADTVSFLCQGKASESDKAAAIYNYVQKRMKWNGYYNLWASNGLKKPFNDRTGNSSEINLLLTLMLQTAGLNANPVLFSTRDNGFANSYFPSITKYNSVLTKVMIDGKTILLDATSEYCPMGMLPANDINGKGRVVNNQNGDWVDIQTQDRYKESRNYVLKLLPDGNLTGTIKGTYDGYAGLSYRKALDKEKTNDDYIRKMEENMKGLSINGFSITNKKDIDKPVFDSLAVEISDHTELLGDKILFQPLLFETIEKNIYTLEDRKYPVNYNFPTTETYNFEYTIPDGFQVESIPAPAVIKLPNNDINIIYNTQVSGNKIYVTYRMIVNKTLYLPEEYKNLKEFYDQLVKKNSENIILKKTT